MKSYADFEHTALCDISAILATVAGAKTLLESSDASLNDESVCHAVSLLHAAQLQIKATQTLLDKGISRKTKAEKLARLTSNEIERIEKKSQRK
jgi:hypothetical protein